MKTLAGRVCLSIVGTLAAIGSFFFDWNETHVKNPNWPPHAKFHNAQTMSTGALLGASTLYFAWRRNGDKKTNAFTAALFAGNYFWTQFASGWFPGVAWTDPEFLREGERLDDRFFPQRRVDVVATAIVLLGAYLMRSDDGAKPSRPRCDHCGSARS